MTSRTLEANGAELPLGAEVDNKVLEDFHVGEVEQIGRRLVDKAEVIAFATQFDPQPFHIDEAAAKRSMYGGLIASGWHTCAMVMRMMCDAYLAQAASVGSPGI